MKVNAKQYANVLFELTDGKSEQDISVIVQKFAKQLQKDGQLKNSKKILDKFSEIYNMKNGIVSAEIRVKESLENETREKLERFLKSKYSAREVELKVVSDEKIKGGIIVSVHDEVLDGSLAGKLRRLKKTLIS